MGKPRCDECIYFHSEENGKTGVCKRNPQEFAKGVWDWCGEWYGENTDWNFQQWIFNDTYHPFEIPEED